jgi:putative acetyltransferase
MPLFTIIISFVPFKKSVAGLSLWQFPQRKIVMVVTLCYNRFDKLEFTEAKDMKIIEVTGRNALLIEQLLKVWESSVKATHLFLSTDEISNIKQYVPQALHSVPVLVVAKNENGNPVGFMGIVDKMLEMLFISNESRGQGIGTQLLQYGIDIYSVNELAVNEQNPLAKGFYEHMGFEVYKRTELDEQGNPYPLLYMKRD